MLNTKRAAGKYVSAGLPNIKGEIAGNYNSGAPTGAFKEIYQGFGFNSSGTVSRGFTFDASRSSSIYGNSNTVQPSAVAVKMLIKY